jgi:thiazole synthase ThiGH ThiG subunit
MNAETRIIGEDSWSVAGRSFRSRLIVGTGKYKSFEQNAAAVEASGAEIVTVAVRRVNIADPKQPMLTDFIDPKRITYLPNTAGCFTPRTRSAPCGWRARRAAGRSSNSKCSARPRRCTPT